MDRLTPTLTAFERRFSLNGAAIIEDQGDDFPEENDEVEVVDVKLNKIYVCKICRKMCTGFIEIQRHFKRKHYGRGKVIADVQAQEILISLPVDETRPKVVVCKKETPPQKLLTGKISLADLHPRRTSDESDSDEDEGSLKEDSSNCLPNKTDKRKSSPNNLDRAPKGKMFKGNPQTGPVSLQSGNSGSVRAAQTDEIESGQSIVYPPLALSQRLPGPSHPIERESDGFKSKYPLEDKSRRQSTSSQTNQSMQQAGLTITEDCSLQSQASQGDSPDPPSPTEEEPMFELGSPSVANGDAVSEIPGYPCNRCLFQFPTLESLESHTLLEHSRSSKRDLLPYNWNMFSRRPPVRRKKSREGKPAKTYCLCEKKSQGYMIRCDNRFCKTQWFHFRCVGLSATAAPADGKWYCPVCIEL